MERCCTTSAAGPAGTNLPANAGTVSDVRARSAPHSIAVHNSDAIHPFSGYEGGQVDLYGLAVQSPRILAASPTSFSTATTSTAAPTTGPSSCIWIRRPGKVNDSIRDPNATVTLPIVYDQWVQIRIEVDLRSGLGNGQRIL